MGLTSVGDHRFGADFLAAFDVEAELGTGMSGAVLLACQRSLGRRVAIKLLDKYAPQLDALQQRFAREAHILCSLRHPNLITIYDYGFDGNVPYLVQEYLQGATLQERLESGVSYTVDETLSLVLEVARALEHAHRAGVLHRDVKPANVFCTDDGRVVLLDFGLAVSDSHCTALTRPGYVVGTPLYMAPEQLTAAPVTPSADVYALGTIMFLMLAGDFPFSGERSDFYLAKVDCDAPSLAELRPDVPADVAAVVNACLARRPDERPTDGTALVTRLRNCRRSTPHPAKVSVPSGGRRRSVVAVVATIAVMVAVVVGRSRLQRPTAVVLQRDVLAVDAYATEVVVRLVAEPPCRATVTLAVDGHDAPQARSTAVVNGAGTLRLTAPSETAYRLVVHFADRPRATVVERAVVLPPPQVEVLLGPEHLEPTKSVPRRLARALAAGRLRAWPPPFAVGSRVAVGTRQHGLFVWSLAAEKVVWYNEALSSLHCMTGDDERLVVVAADDSVRALSWRDGGLLWQRPGPGSLDMRAYCRDGLAFFRRKGSGASITALALADGEQRWVQRDEQFTQPWSVSGGRTFVAFMLGGSRVFAAATGAPLPAPEVLGAELLSTDVVVDGGDVFVGRYTSSVAGGPLDGAPRFVTAVKSEPRDLVVDDARTYVICDNPPHVAALDRWTGVLVWERPLGSNPQVHIAVATGRVYAVATDGAGRQIVWCLDGATGQCLARYAWGVDGVHRPLLVPGGLLLVGTDGSMRRVTFQSTQ